MQLFRAMQFSSNNNNNSGLEGERYTNMQTHDCHSLSNEAVYTIAGSLGGLGLWNVFKHYRSKGAEGTECLATQERLNRAASLAKKTAAAPDFSSKLQIYHDCYANIPRSIASEAQKVVQKVRDCLQRYFSHRCPELGAIKLKPMGSSTEGLMVISPDEFDVGCVITLDPCSWEFALQPETPGDVLIRGRRFYGKSSVCDKFVQEGCLCPNQLFEYLDDKTQKAVRKIPKYKIKVSGFDSSIRMRICYGGNRIINLNLIPTIEIGNANVNVARPVSLQGSNHTKNYTTHSVLWRQSFFDNEHNLLMNGLPSSCCHIILLRVVNAIRLNFSTQFGLFGAEVYRMVLLRMIQNADPDEWRKEFLGERFVDFLETFHACLESHSLPHVCNPDHNLLGERSVVSHDHTRSYVRRLLGEGQLHVLLARTEYSGLK